MIEIVVLGLSLGLIYIYISTANNLKLNESNEYDAKNKYIVNIKNPENPTHVVTVDYVDKSVTALSQTMNTVQEKMADTYKGLKRSCEEEGSAVKKRITDLETAQLNPDDIMLKTNKEITSAIASLELPFYATVKDGVLIDQDTNDLPLVFDYSSGGTALAELGSGYIFIKSTTQLKIEILIKLSNDTPNINRILIKDTFGVINRELELLSVANYFHLSYDFVKTPNDKALSFIISSDTKGLFYPYIKISSEHASNDFCFKPILSDLQNETKLITTKIEDVVKAQTNIIDTLVTKTFFKEELNNMVTESSFSETVTSQEARNETFVSKSDFNKLKTQINEVKNDMVTKANLEASNKKIKDEMVSKKGLKIELDKQAENMKPKILNGEINTGTGGVI